MEIFREVFLRLSDICGAVGKLRVRFKLHKYWKTEIIHARCYCNRLFLQSQQKAPKCKQAFFKYPATDCFLLPCLFSFRILMFFPIITHQVGVEMLLLLLYVLFSALLCFDTYGMCFVQLFEDITIGNPFRQCVKGKPV